MLRAALGLFFLFAGATAAAAQTDDRILNDVLIVMRGEAILAGTGSVCGQLAGNDLAATLAAWTKRNGEVIERGAALISARGPIDTVTLDTLREYAQAEATREIVRAPDHAERCASVGSAIDAGQLDLAAWFPRETQRMVEAEDGQWPPLELEGVQAIADAMAVKQIAFMISDVFVRCAALFQPTEQFEEASSEWQARNGYVLELADRVLLNWGALHPRRWEAARDEAGAAIDVLFADTERAEAHCRMTASRATSGAEDFDQMRPELFESVQANAEIVPR